jgi:hypothetical protein
MTNPHQERFRPPIQRDVAISGGRGSTSVILWILAGLIILAIVSGLAIITFVF